MADPLTSPLLTSLLGQVPRQFQNPVNQRLKDQRLREKRKIEEQLRAQAAGNQGLPPGFELGRDGLPRLKVQRVPQGGGSNRVDVNTLGATTRGALEMGAARNEALRGLLKFEGPIDLNAPRSGSKAEILRRFGVTKDQDFDTASKAIWDYIESGRDLTQPDLAGLREWATHKRRSTAGDESPWWLSDSGSFEDELSSRTVPEAFEGLFPSGLGALSKMERSDSDKESFARRSLMNYILGGWDEKANELGMPQMIGTSRGYDWGRGPDDVREQLKAMTPSLPSVVEQLGHAAGRDVTFPLAPPSGQQHQIDFFGPGL